jgi:hypothetical protein
MREPLVINVHIIGPAPGIAGRSVARSVSVNDPTYELARAIGHALVDSLLDEQGLVTSGTRGTKI